MRLLLIASVPPVSVIVPVALMLIVSPELAAAIASRKEPAPLSAVEVTLMVAARLDDGTRNPTIAKTARKPFMTTPSAADAPQPCTLRIAPGGSLLRPACDFAG